MQLLLPDVRCEFCCGDEDIARDLESDDQRVYGASQRVLTTSVGLPVYATMVNSQCVRERYLWVSISPLGQLDNNRASRMPMAPVRCADSTHHERIPYNA